MNEIKAEFATQMLERADCGGDNLSQSSLLLCSADALLYCISLCGWLSIPLAKQMLAMSTLSLVCVVPLLSNVVWGSDLFHRAVPVSIGLTFQSEAKS